MGHRKEFKHTPESKSKGKFIREGVMFRRQCGLLSETEWEPRGTERKGNEKDRDKDTPSV